jgi:CheY-like chemotaxis protein
MRVRFSVCDTGPGIPAWARPRLFEPFSQIDGTSSRRHGGTGLGLAICQRLVGLMGGEIEVESEERAGSTFSFALSFARPATTADPRPAPPALEVLVVEPHAACADVVCAYLEGWGMSAVRVDDPAELSGCRFDVGIVAGSEQVPSAALARAVHAQPDCAHLPLVLLSDVGRALSQAAGEGDAPFAAVVTKPVKRDRLLDALVLATGGAPAPTGSPTRPVPLARPQLNGARATVLVAEDNAVNRALLLRQLAKLGLEAESVTGGREAVDAVASGRYDAVLMDCHMPDVDGFQAASAIRAAEAGGRRTPIVAITAGAMDLDRDRCAEAGMDGYLVKPVTTSELGDALAPWAAPAPVEASRRAVIDPQALERLEEDLGDRDELRRIARIYVEQLAPAREAMTAALTAEDADRLAGAAHRLRSTSASFGASELARLCGDLESRARTGAARATGPLVERIAAESETVRTSLGAALGL